MNPLDVTNVLAALKDAFASIDVRHRLAELRVPTLILHSRGESAKVLR